ncbi:LemA family protein, partial [Wenyingzhuangia sp. 1_MG-2023]|nr:LemA family protein [Wenyingzhuangia sp. 1_MG-2023]
MVVAVRYTDLKASHQFLGLQTQLEGTENRINLEINRFIYMVFEYNTMIRKFQKNIKASIFYFEKMEYFKAD